MAKRLKRKSVLDTRSMKHAIEIGKVAEDPMVVRQRANFQILDHLRSYFDANPNMRFCQGLIALHILAPDCDQFYENSEETLDGLERLSTFEYVKEFDSADHS